MLLSHSPYGWKSIRRAAVLVAGVLLLVSQRAWPEDSQEPKRPSRGGPPPGWKVVSPELHADGKVTFRVYAPNASKVRLEAFEMVGGHVDLSPGEESTWSVTVGPVLPDLYTYRFLVDEVPTVDPKNHLGQYRPSLIEVPGREAEFLALGDVPHGTIHQHFYRSQTISGVRPLCVYTPPQYEQDADATFPVLYLLHGSGETEKAWSTIGRAGIILDNLLAQQKAKPMVIVMPYGHTRPPTVTGWPFTGSDDELFAEDLLNDVMPLVEKKYRVSRQPADRALAGFSMGGAQALVIGLNNLDRFSHLGVFSWGGDRDFFKKRFPSVLSQPESLNRQVRVFWLGCGRADFLYARATAMHECLTELGVRHTLVESPGGHWWTNWRHYLYEFAQLLFQDPSRT